MNSKFVILDSNQNEVKRQSHFVNVEEEQYPKLYIEPPKSWLEQIGFLEPIIEPFESIQPIKRLKFINVEPLEFEESTESDSDTLFEILGLMSNTPPETDVLLEVLELMLLKTQSDSIAIHSKSYNKTLLNRRSCKSGRYTQRLLELTPKVMLNRLGLENLQIYLNEDEENEDGEEDNHEDKDYSIYSCQMCDGKQSVSKRSLNLHMEKFHAEAHKYETAKWQKCDTCQKKFINLIAHIMKMHLDLDSFKCDECSVETKTASSLTQHYKEVHMNVRFICEHCKKPYTRNESLRQHVFNTHPETVKTCLKCKRKFMNKLSLKRHEKNSKKKGKCTVFNRKSSGYKCTICGASFPTYWGRMHHKMKSHLK